MRIETNRDIQWEGKPVKITCRFRTCIQSLSHIIWLKSYITHMDHDLTSLLAELFLLADSQPAWLFCGILFPLDIRDQRDQAVLNMLSEFILLLFSASGDARKGENEQFFSCWFWKIGSLAPQSERIGTEQTLWGSAISRLLLVWIRSPSAYSVPSYSGPFLATLFHFWPNWPTLSRQIIQLLKN